MDPKKSILVFFCLALGNSFVNENKKMAATCKVKKSLHLYPWNFQQNDDQNGALFLQINCRPIRRQLVEMVNINNIFIYLIFILLYSW